MSESVYKKKQKYIVNEASNVKTLIAKRKDIIKLRSMRTNPNVISIRSLSSFLI